MSQEANSNVHNRSFLGALAAAIKALCMLLIDGVGVAQEGVAMADKAVKVARTRQAIELEIDMSDFTTVAVVKGAHRQVVAMEELELFIGKDNTGKRKELVDAARANLTKLVNAEVARINSERRS